MQGRKKLHVCTYISQNWKNPCLQVIKLTLQKILLILNEVVEYH